MGEAKRLLAVIGEAYDVNFNCDDQLIGGCAIDATRADTDRSNPKRIAAELAETRRQP